MPIYINSDLTGDGDIPAGSSGLTFFRRVFIQDTGGGHPIQLGNVERWLGLGWTALYETLPGNDGNGPAGQSFIDRQWVEFLYQGFESSALVNAMQGASGVHYSFLPGVVATVVTYET